MFVSWSSVHYFLVAPSDDPTSIPDGDSPGVAVVSCSPGGDGAGEKLQSGDGGECEARERCVISLPVVCRPAAWSHRAAHVELK